MGFCTCLICPHNTHARSLREQQYINHCCQRYKWNLALDVTLCIYNKHDNEGSIQASRCIMKSQQSVQLHRDIMVNCCVLWCWIQFLFKQIQRCNQLTVQHISNIRQDMTTGLSQQMEWAIPCQINTKCLLMSCQLLLGLILWLCFSC